MSIKIISYDLHRPEQNYSELIKAINNYDCCKINKSDWLVRTYVSCKIVRDDLKKYIDYNDTLFVAELSEKSGWWASYDLDKKAVNWLNNLQAV
ncbi:CRISPR-associated protein Cas2 [bacterium]|nr:CRISPR-associated protein Cas2 [bacterium]